MTNEEAIKIIEIAKAEIEWTAPLEYQVAFDMATDALKNKVSIVTHNVTEEIVITEDKISVKVDGNVFYNAFARLTKEHGGDGE